MRLGLHYQYVAYPAFEIFLAIAISHLKPHSLPLLIFRQYIKSSFSILLLPICDTSEFLQDFIILMCIKIHLNDIFHIGKVRRLV
jgi:hypothetical protein